ncbi:MAG TPA: glycosyltransferase, partial [Longimicrobiales bacterium]|nr:glycosyltransferase [Longimicrobiales bacterium]
MRILHAFAPAPVGGLERVVAELAAGHRARGHEVHVVASVSPPLDPALTRFLAELRRRCLDVHRLDVPARAYLRERTLGVGLLRRLRPDLVHTHGLRCDVVFGGAARALGIRTVTTVHGYTGGGAWMRGMETVQRAALRRFDAVVAVSGPLAARLASAGVPRARIRVIPNAWRADAPPLLTRRAARERLGLNGPHVHLGWVGRLSREKGPDVFIDALGELRDLPFVASILGDGPDAARL